MTAPERRAAASVEGALGPLAVLVGVWEGDGHGQYPTIEPFRYHERVTLEHHGKPFLAYAQTTRDADTGEPRHREVGYLRPGQREDMVELLIAQPSGYAEVHEGRLADGVLDLHLTSLARTTTAKPVHLVRRRFEIVEDVLSYDLWMAHADTPETHHLRAALHRVPAR